MSKRSLKMNLNIKPKSASKSEMNDNNTLSELDKPQETFEDEHEHKFKS